MYVKASEATGLEFQLEIFLNAFKKQQVFFT
jgi:hypothetical protein